MIRLFKNLQNFKDILKKIYFFQKFWGGLGPPWSLSGSATNSYGITIRLFGYVFITMNSYSL